MLGSIVALFSFSIIVYVIEADKSLVQLLIGFFLFILPVMFISSFQSTTPVFILVLFTAFFAYGMYKFEYYDTLYGFLLAIIIGGSISYFRINKYKLFSTSEYKREATGTKESD